MEGDGIIIKNVLNQYKSNPRQEFSSKVSFLLAIQTLPDEQFNPEVRSKLLPMLALLKTFFQRIK